MGPHHDLGRGRWFLSLISARPRRGPGVTTTGHPSGDRTGHGDPISVTTAPSALGGVTAHTERLAIPAYEVFMLLLSGLSIFNVIVVVGVWLVGWNGPGQEVVLAMDVAMTPIFVVDFVYRFRSAASRNATWFTATGGPTSRRSRRCCGSSGCRGPPWSSPRSVRVVAIGCSRSSAPRAPWRPSC